MNDDIDESAKAAIDFLSNFKYICKRNGRVQAYEEIIEICENRRKMSHRANDAIGVILYDGLISELEQKKTLTKK